jgi:hypothetical protein
VANDEIWPWFLRRREADGSEDEQQGERKAQDHRQGIEAAGIELKPGFAMPALAGLTAGRTLLLCAAFAPRPSS